MTWTQRGFAVGAVVDGPGAASSVLPDVLRAGEKVTGRFLVGNTSAQRQDFQVRWGDITWYEKP